jgi:hypothetical protein
MTVPAVCGVPLLTKMLFRSTKLPGAADPEMSVSVGSGT